MRFQVFSRCYRYLKRRIESIVFTGYYKLIFKFGKLEYGLNKNPNRAPKIIVSLTSIPSRLDCIHLSILTLMRQTVKPDRIILYLGIEKCEHIQLPQKLLRLKKYGLEIIYRSDLMPHTKYFYAITENPDSIVITVDDDILYRKDLVELLMNSYTRYPKAISCFRAKRIKTDATGALLPYDQWEPYCTSIKEPSLELVALGVEGVLYPPHCMSAEAFNLDAIRKYSLRNDDLWLKMMQLLSGTKVVRVPVKSNRKIEIMKAQKIALYKSNVNKGQNDLYIQNIVSAYNIDIKKIY